MKDAEMIVGVACMLSVLAIAVVGFGALLSGMAAMLIN